MIAHPPDNTSGRLLEEKLCGCVHAESENEKEMKNEKENTSVFFSFMKDEEYLCLFFSFDSQDQE